MYFRNRNTMRHSSTQGAAAIVRRSVPLLLLGICVACSVAAFAATAHAEDINDPPWVVTPSDPQWAGGVTTTQTWEFELQPNWPVDGGAGNPFGTASVSFPFGSATYPDPIPGPDGNTINTWHIDVDNALMEVRIPNDPTPRDRKVLFIQLTSDKAPLPGFPVSNPAGTTTYPIGPVGHGSTTWYTYTSQIEIDGNPSEELLSFMFQESTNISELVIDTICVDVVPEPGTATMLVGVALVSCVCSFRRRRTR